MKGVMIFLTKNNILYKRQYGYRNKHSTYMAALDFINDMNKAIDNNMYTAGIFMDLSKAFDTIDHEILLDMVLEVFHMHGLQIISQIGNK